MKRKPFWERHSLTLAAAGILLLWLVFYLMSDPQSRPGSFFGNAIGDWTGVVMTVLATKWLFERGSDESRQPRRAHKSPILEFFHEHSLTIFLLATGIGWLTVFARVDPGSRWGSVAGNLLSEWSQQIGLIVLTKRLIESGSKESRSR